MISSPLELYFLLRLCSWMSLFAIGLIGMTFVLGDKYRSKIEFIYLFAPIAIILAVGLFLEAFDFKYMAQYITVSGPVLSAFIALYISKTNVSRAKMLEKSKMRSLLEFNYNLIVEGTRSLKRCIINYSEFIGSLSESSTAMRSFLVTHFDYYEKVINQDLSILYDAIRMQNGNLNTFVLFNETIETIINILHINRIDNEQYQRFIDGFNIPSTIWTDHQTKLNSIIREIASFAPRDVFREDILSVIQEFNNSIKDNPGLLDNIDHKIEKLLDPLMGLIFIHHNIYSQQLVLLLTDAKMRLLKMKEINGHINDHYVRSLELLKDAEIKMDRNIEKWNEFLKIGI